MGEEIRTFKKEAKKRWVNKMPKFFRLIMYACAFVAGLALSVNTAITLGGGVPHEWWNDIYPYLLGIPAGAAFCAKFTVDGGFRDKSMDKLNKNTILDHDNV